MKNSRGGLKTTPQRVYSFENLLLNWSFRLRDTPSLWLRCMEGFLRCWRTTSHLMIQSKEFHSIMKALAVMKCNFLRRQRRTKYRQRHLAELHHNLRNDSWNTYSTQPTLYTLQFNIRYQFQVRVFPYAIRSRDRAKTSSRRLRCSVGPTIETHLPWEGGWKKS